MVRLRDQREAPVLEPWTTQTSQSGFERSRRWEKIRPTRARSWSSLPGFGSAVAHVVVEVEVGVVDPERPSGLEPRKRQLLAVAGHATEPRGQVVLELLASRRRPVEDDEGAHVHVRRLLLLSEEGGVHRAQTVLVDSCGAATRAYPVTIAPVKLLGIVLAVQVALGIALVALVATDNLPFTGDHEADGSPVRPASVHVDRFDGAAAFRLLRRQVELGPRPADRLSRAGSRGS